MTLNKAIYGEVARDYDWKFSCLFPGISIYMCMYTEIPDISYWVVTFVR